MTTSPKRVVAVRGFCPMGCGSTLMLTAAGEIRCWEFHCPNKAAAGQILADSETDHVVSIAGEGFTVRHPLRERLADQLLHCDLSAKLGELPREGRQEGTFRAWRRHDGAGPAWHLVPIA